MRWVWSFVNEKPGIKEGPPCFSMCQAHMSEAEVGSVNWIQLRNVGMSGCVPSGWMEVDLSICHEPGLPDSISGQKGRFYPWKHSVWSPQSSTFLLWKLKMAKVHLEAGGWRNCTISSCAVISLFLFPASLKCFHYRDIQLPGLHFLLIRSLVFSFI